MVQDTRWAERRKELQEELKEERARQFALTRNDGRFKLPKRKRQVKQELQPEPEFICG